ncbi:hypothetical protein CGZ93_03060 [Enemella dayhoffiae]|uniref:DUF1772 domain-containing protein n=1 Tax=Enemella dayhoffiae TaxID=2016507 RepID=A0A255HAP3_9ACTN|nr:anthrone oxygenase family protein [Enemella dayhoffiae]OYO24687.1 hypothetical protein CGZ93_03060 [Enemella dayhoffiae]
MLPLLGSAAGGALVGVLAAIDRAKGNRPLLILGAGLAVAAFTVTAAYHVPCNNQLATLTAGSAAAKDYWLSYARDWTRMNHVRVALLLASGACLVAGALND